MSIDYGRQIANAVDNAFSKGKTIATEAERELVGMRAHGMQRQLNIAMGKVYGIVERELNRAIDDFIDSMEAMYDDEW